MADSEIVQRLLQLQKEGTLKPSLDEVSLSLEESMGIIELGRLDWSPRSNWVQENGGLPRYIETVAIGIMKGTGYPRERAIPIAISRIKRWAAGLDGVKADTKAKAIAALAQWEKMKASAAAKRAAKG